MEIIKKSFLIYSITLLVILNLSILTINLFSLTFFELDGKNNLSNKIFELSFSTCNELNALLLNKNLNDPIIKEKFEYVDEIKSIGKFETYEIFLVDKECKTIIHSDRKRVIDSLQLFPVLKNKIKTVFSNTTFTFKDNYGRYYTVSICKLKNKDLFVVSIISHKVGMATFNSIRHRIIILSLMISIIGSIMILFVTYKIYRKLHNPSPNKA